MTTHRAIVDALLQAASDGDSLVLATVVRVTGSSYGGVGARMLIRVDGSTVGLVSGGCLESDLAEHARRATATGRAEVVRYDTRDDDDAPWGLGLGCNGLIDVLVEPLPPELAKSISSLLDRALRGAMPSVVATVIKTNDSATSADSVGAHALFAAQKVSDGETGEDSVDLSAPGSDNAPLATTGEWESLLALVSRDVTDAVAAGRRGLVREYNGVEVAFEVVHPAVQLIICGSGPDVVPIARSASQLGWDVTVVDHRPVASERSDRFPGAGVVECADATRLADVVQLTSQSAAVVMSHHIVRDGGYVQSLLAGGVAYIGVLGPRARTERMLAEIADNTGGVIDTGDRVFAPVGMDIGGEGPEAIALAIIAEVSAVLARRGGGHLRDRRGPLHLARS